MNPTIRITQHNSNLLNLIRVIATWAVLLGHCFSYYQVTFLKDQAVFPYIQNIGVVLLFILSGFLTAFSIHRKLSVNADYDYRTFFIERTSRIYSAYLPALVFVFLIDAVNLLLNSERYMYLKSLNPINFLANVMMLQDFPLLGRWFTSFGSGRPFWTLAIEWWAYVFFGYVVLVVYKNWKKNTLQLSSILILCVLSFEPILRMVGGRGNGLMTTWLLGVGIYLIYQKNHVKPTQFLTLRLLTLLSCVGTFLTALWFKDAYNSVFVFSLSVTILLSLINGNQLEKGKDIKLFSLLASYTYSLYLVHYSIVDLLYQTDLSLTTTQRILISVVVSNLVAILFYRLFEKRGKSLTTFLLQRF